MCGHVGIAGKLLNKDDATMKRLLMLDYFRGPDSTGFASMRTDGTVKIAKIASHPLDLFEDTRFKAALNGQMSTVFLGHNRSATKGKVTSYNAHPFQFDHIVGAHNGTLSTESHRRLEKKLGEAYEVDSMAIFACIAKFGIEETVALFRASEDKVSCPDAWALVWYDLTDKTLNFLRNKERPMWYCLTKEFDRVLWASEWPMLQAAVAMSGAGYELYEHESKTEPGKVFRFFHMDADVHYRFDVDALKKGSTERPKPMAHRIEGKEVAYSYSSSGNSGHDPFQRNRDGHWPSTSVGSTTPTTRISTSRGTTDAAKKEREDALDVMHVFAERNDPYGGIITPERFATLNKYGCAWCESDIAYEAVGCTVIDGCDSILCPDCSSSSPKQNRIYMKEVNVF